MPSARGFSLLLTASQAAARLGLPIQTVLGWAAAGELRIAGQDEDGRALFREAVINSRGKELAAADRAKALRTNQARNMFGTPACRPLPCGCDPQRSPPCLCRDGLALNTAVQFAELLTFMMPDGPLPPRLAEICRDALMRHLGPATSPVDEATEHSASKSVARQPAVPAPSPKLAIETRTGLATG
jgi:hypothetical protein